MARFAVIDFETSGLAPDAGGRALEIAAVIVEDGAIVDSWQSLMNPGIRVPHFITQLTGISPLMVRMAPPPAEVMVAVARFVSDATVVAHNASFDHNLATLVDLHKIPVEGQYHRALADASMTAHLFITMQRDLEQLYAGETIDTDFLLKYQKTTKNQVKATSGAPARYK